MKLLATLLGCVLLAAPAHADIPFSAETVPFGDDIGQWIGLAIDSRGNPHIVCLNADTFDLMYATRVGDTWIVVTP